jgi:hypothetical protein
MGWHPPSAQSKNFPWYQYFTALGKWVLRNMDDYLVRGIGLSNERFERKKCYHREAAK